MAIDILVLMTGAGVISCHEIAPGTTNTAFIALYQLPEPLSSNFFIIQQPGVLDHVLKDTTPSVQKISNGMRELRLDTLHPLSNTQLTLAEKLGAIDGPTTTQSSINSVKADETFKCFVRGCAEKKKAWLEASLANARTSRSE
ncbi:hypothetical protein N7508_000588 [Penicillium antarcticum]|uniref:uncharacterized protein n=1 Tax=Penicillium antarcticum TaxID=416450 RepID=UPI0023A05593|nr:uncharacterized protein N7508_000588 [Penicillium antarcticum]KAJ5320305.1 hypothetical protein N7508_000588 [Penicillium antarcticum]